MQEYTEGIIYFIRLIITNKKPFFIVTIAAIVLSALFSSKWFIKPKYKSFAVVYPTNLNSYSSESKSEQMMQLLESADIRNQVIRKFNLAQHYKIDTTQAAGVTALISEYESNVSIKRTDFESIQIAVLDTDPVKARDMVLEIMEALNQKARTLQRKQSYEILYMYTNELSQRKKELDSVGSILQSLRMNYRLLDYGTQVKEFTKGYIKHINSSGRSNYKDIDEMLYNLQLKGGEYYTTSKIYESILTSYNASKIEYDKTYTDLNKELTYMSQVTEPTIADKKSYPIRWLIVLVSVISTNFFLLVLLILKDKKNKFI